MGNEAVKLYSDVNTYLDKPIVEKKIQLQMCRCLKMNSK